MPTTYTCFISYRSADAHKVDPIAHKLNLLTFPDGKTPCYITWQDKKQLPPAAPNWWDAIVKAIGENKVFVFFISVGSLTSEVCRAELQYAYERNRPIIPIVLEGGYFLKHDKYDLPEATWKLIPEWLKERQLLFDTGAGLYEQFNRAIAEFEQNFPRDVDANPPRKPGGTAPTNHAEYATAVDYAQRMAFDEAKTLFRNLLTRQDKRYGNVSGDWIELLTVYQELIEVRQHGIEFMKKRLSAEYQQRFPVDFIDGIFDPHGLFTASPPIEVVTPPPSKVVAPPPPPQRQPIQVVPPPLTTRLPAPFGWVEIAGGKGKMKAENFVGGVEVVLDVPTQRYWIAKYPVTKGQFAKFIEADGYKQRQWWTEAGWAERQKDKWTEPRYWRGGKWNGATKPVVGVSWYEAIAFCQWLSEVSGKKITLPSEAQWQYAAQGADGRAYPWGNEWDGGRCNNSVSPHKSSVTTSVTAYEGKGDSPFGVVDMAGNVLEWCLTEYDSRRDDINGKNIRVLRGGSWEGNSFDRFRCDFRNLSYPGNWDHGGGFRLALS